MVNVKFNSNRLKDVMINTMLVKAHLILLKGEANQDCWGKFFFEIENCISRLEKFPKVLSCRYIKVAKIFYIPLTVFFNCLFEEIETLFGIRYN